MTEFVEMMAAPICCAIVRGAEVGTTQLFTRTHDKRVPQEAYVGIVYVVL